MVFAPATSDSRLVPTRGDHHDHPHQPLERSRPSNAGVDDMVATAQITDVAALPLAPKNPLPYRQQVQALRAFHTGQEMLRDAGGPVTRLSFGPKWLLPPVVVATSPQGGPRHPRTQGRIRRQDASFIKKCGSCWATTCSTSCTSLASAPARAATDLHQTARPRLSAATWPRPHRRSPTVGSTERKSTSTPNAAD